MTQPYETSFAAAQQALDELEANTSRMGAIAKRLALLSPKNDEAEIEELNRELQALESRNTELAGQMKKALHQFRQDGKDALGARSKTP